MVALLKDDGEFMPKLVVRDTTAFTQLAETVDQKKEASQALLEMLRENRKRFSVRTK